MKDSPMMTGVYGLSRILEHLESRTDAAVSTEDPVRALYERYPYPNPDPASGLIMDLANGVSFLLDDNDLRGWEVLDIGCGTGQRLVGLAQQYPRAHFVGLEPSDRAREAAGALAQSCGVVNIELHAGSIPSYEPGRPFDLITSTGVLHHLREPLAGACWMVDHLAPDGLIYAWVYHPFGEHDRLIARELVRLLVSTNTEVEGIQTLRELDLSLAPERYGSTSTESDGASNRDIADADAYLHPVVHAWRFAELGKIFQEANLKWLAVHSIGKDNTSHLVDVREGCEHQDLYLQGSRLFETELLKSLYLALSESGRLEALECQYKPTGFSVVGGVDPRLAEMDERFAGNLLFDTSIPTPDTAQKELDRRRRRMVRVGLRGQLLGLSEELIDEFGKDATMRVREGIDMAVGLKPRVLETAKQQPALFYFPGLTARPWIEAEQYQEIEFVVSLLNQNWLAIRDDMYRRFFQNDGAHSHSYVQGTYMEKKFGTQTGTGWLAEDLYANEELTNLQGSYRTTAHVLDEIRDSVSGTAVLSRLQPGTVLPPHFDDNNYKVTAHLPLRVPENCGIRVGGETAAWAEGRCLVFADSYLHEVWNFSTDPRDIILIDLWHPEVTTIERKCLVRLRLILDAACRPEVLVDF